MGLIGVVEIVRVDSMREFYESARDYRTGTMISAIGPFNEFEKGSGIPKEVHLMPTLAHEHYCPFWLLCSYLENTGEPQHIGGVILDLGITKLAKVFPLVSEKRAFSLTSATPGMSVAGSLAVNELEALVREARSEFGTQLEALGRTIAFYYEPQGDQGYLIRYSTEGGRFAGRPKCIRTTEKTDQGFEWRKAEEFV